MNNRILNIFTRGTSTYTIVGTDKELSDEEGDAVIAKWREQIMEVEYQVWLPLSGNEDWNGDPQMKKEELFTRLWAGEGAYLIINQESEIEEIEA